MVVLFMSSIFALLHTLFAKVLRLLTDEDTFYCLINEKEKQKNAK